MTTQVVLRSGDPRTGQPAVLTLATGGKAAVVAAAAALNDAALQQSLPPPGPLQVVSDQQLLGVAEMRQLLELLQEAGLELVGVTSSNPRTRVAAAALGLIWNAPPIQAKPAEDSGESAQDPPQGLRIHQGTLRSGDHLEAPGSVLVLGDVNPGARITACGHVLVWGQLRGVAHAGSQGDCSARIVALQLRPVQLRIADRVARGPADTPPLGLAEQALLVDGAIAIEPAQPGWPLSG